MTFDSRNIYYDLPDGWRYVNVSEIADVNRASITKKNEPAVIRYVDISSVSTNVMEEPKSLNFSEAPSRARRIVRTGDFLISTVRPNLKQYVYVKAQDANLVASTGFAVVSPHNYRYGQYLYAVLTSAEFTEYLVRVADGAAYPAFNPKEISEAVIPWPPDPSLFAVNNFIASVDGKIDLNRQINQTLEQIAQTIFKSWFVDFEPVKAKIEAKSAGRDPERAAMCAISGKLEPELNQLPPEQYQQLAVTAALFPDELVESELGLIPVGWEVKSVSDISKYATGKIDVSTLSVDNYISTENMLENKGGVGFASTLPSVPTVPSFSKGQVLISNIRPYFKKIWLARFDGGRSNDVLCFESFEEDCIEFLYNLFYQDEFFNFMMRTSKGAKMPRGDKGAIAGWKFACPENELRSFFSTRVRPYYTYIESLTEEAEYLSLARDALLPKLLSGDLISICEKEAAAFMV